MNRQALLLLHLFNATACTACCQARA